MTSIPSTKFLQTIIGLACMSWVMNSICKMQTITPEHYNLLTLFLQIAGGVIFGSNLLKTAQNVNETVKIEKILNDETSEVTK